MNKKLLSIACLLGTLGVQAQVGIGTEVPNKSAELSIISSNRGLLIPNIALKDVNDNQTITSGNVESLLVYNTTTNATLSAGFYYWDNSLWQALTTEQDIPEIVINHFQEIVDDSNVYEILRTIIRNESGNVYHDGNNFYRITSDNKKTLIEFERIVREEPVLTILSYSPQDGLLSYQDERQNIYTVDIAAAVKNFQSITRIEQDNTNGTFTFYNEKNEPVVVDIKAIVKEHETITKLEKVKDGLYTYTNEANEDFPISIVGDITNLIQSKQDLDFYVALQHFVKSEQSLTSLVFDYNTSMLTYIDESGKTVSYDVKQIVQNLQQKTLIDQAKSKNIVVHTENKGEVIIYTLEVPLATRDSVGVVSAGNGLDVSADGKLSVDTATIDKASAITSTSLDIQNGADAVLKDVSLEIKPGQAKQVLVTTADASAVEWVDQTSIDKNTTNTLSVDNTTLTSVVNGVAATVDLMDHHITSTKGIKGASIIVDGGAGSSLQDVNLEVKHGLANEVLLTNATGTGVVWTAQSSLVPITTNALSLDKNTLKSVVNGVDSSVDLTHDNIVSTKKITGTSIAVGGGNGASLADVTLEVAPGAAAQVLATNAKGDAVQWIDQSTLIPTTTNALSIKDNILTSTVNGIDASTELTLDAKNIDNTKDIKGTSIVVTDGTGAVMKEVNLEVKPGKSKQILATTLDGKSVEWVNQESINTDTTNLLSLDKNTLKSVVNGVDSSVDLTHDNIVSTKKITGTSIAVGGGNGASLADVTLEVAPGAAAQILATNAKGDAVQWIDPSTLIPTTTNALSIKDNMLTSTVNGIDASTELTLDAKNIDNTKDIKGTSIVVTDGTGAVMKEVNLEVKPGKSKQILATTMDGKSVEWVNQESINTDTTNFLSLNQNTLKSVVNGVDSSVDLTQDNIVSSKKITGTSIAVGGGNGASLADVTLEVAPGGAAQVLATNAKGDAVQWIDQSSLVPTTTNSLSLDKNTLKSVVNGVDSSVDLTHDNIVSTKKITGTSIAVGGGNGASLADVTLEVAPGGAAQVLATNANGDAVEWIDQSSLVPTTTNSLSLDKNTLKSVVNGVDSSVDLTQDNIVSTKKITGTSIAVGGGNGASLADVTLEVAHGAAAQVLATNAKGDAVEWIDPSTLIPTTTNVLSSSENKMKSMVNGKESEADIVNSVDQQIIGNELKVSVNGVKSQGVNLKDIIPTFQHKTVVTQGSTAIQIDSVSTTHKTTYSIGVDPSKIDLSGDVTGALNANKVVALQNVKLASTAPLDKQSMIYNAASTQWEPTTLVINANEVNNPKKLTSTDLTISGQTNGALLEDLIVDIATDAVTSLKIKDYTILAKDMADTTSNHVLVTSGIGKVKWESQSNIVVQNQKTTSVSTESDDIVVSKVEVNNNSDYVIDVKAAMPKFFYMPSIVIPTAQGQSSLVGVSFNNATREGEVNLYAIYENQFGSPVVSSRPQAEIPVLDASELDFHITYLDNTVFEVISLSDLGVLKYRVKPTAIPTKQSFMNIVFSIR